MFSRRFICSLLFCTIGFVAPTSASGDDLQDWLAKGGIIDYVWESCGFVYNGKKNCEIARWKLRGQGNSIIFSGQGVKSTIPINGRKRFGQYVVSTTVKGNVLTLKNTADPTPRFPITKSEFIFSVSGKNCTLRVDIEITNISSDPYGPSRGISCSLRGGSVGKTKMTSETKDQRDVECPVTIRHITKADYYATNPCKKTNVLAVVDTIELVPRKCVRTIETVQSDTTNHLITSHHKTAPKKIFQCATTTSSRKKAAGCTPKILKAQYGNSC